MNFNRQKSKLERFKDKMFLSAISFGVLAVALTPTWIYLLARFLFNPDNALVEILLFGVSLYFMGGIQIIFLIIALIFIVAMWNEV